MKATFLLMNVLAALDSCDSSGAVQTDNSQAFWLRFLKGNPLLLQSNNMAEQAIVSTTGPSQFIHIKKAHPTLPKWNVFKKLARRQIFLQALYFQFNNASGSPPLSQSRDQQG